MSDVEKYYYESMAGGEKAVTEALVQEFRRPRDECGREIERFLKDYNLLVKSELRLFCQDLGLHLKRKFEHDFYRDKEGVSRHWATMTEAEINAAFRECRKSTLEFALRFRSVSLVPPGVSGRLMPITTIT